MMQPLETDAGAARRPSFAPAAERAAAARQAGWETAEAAERMRRGSVLDAQGSGAEAFDGGDVRRARAMSATEIARESMSRRAEAQKSMLPFANPLASPESNAGSPSVNPLLFEGGASPAAKGDQPAVSLWPWHKLVALAAGPLIFAACFREELDEQYPRAPAMLGAALWIACWWLAEVVPLAAGALMPIILFGPLEILDTKATAASYMNQITFLVFGAFLVDVAIERTNLHKRAALWLIVRFGATPARQLAAFMTVSFLLSMFCLNTSTTMMLVPFAVGILEQAEGDAARSDAPVKALQSVKNVGKAILIGIAWASNCGGTATLIGSAPNGVLVGVIRDTYPNTDVEVNFTTWMAWGIPVAILLVVPAYAILYVFFLRNAGLNFEFDEELLEDQLRSLGNLRYDEIVVATAQVLQIALWLARGSALEPYWGTCTDPSEGTHPKNMYACKANGGEWSSPVTGWDAGIACGVAMILFLLPSRTNPGKRILEWSDAVASIPWDALLLLGGGFALANGFKASGLGHVAGNEMEGISTMMPFTAACVVAGTVAFLTEFTSNTATTGVVLPILAGVASEANVNPYLYLLPATLGASLAFMLPIATPPNAIAFATGRVDFTDMAAPGLLMNMIGVAAIAGVTVVIAREIVCDGGSFRPAPDWAKISGSGTGGP